jgi:hypothetical protein
MTEQEPQQSTLDPDVPSGETNIAVPEPTVPSVGERPDEPVERYYVDNGVRQLAVFEDKLRSFAIGTVSSPSDTRIEAGSVLQRAQTLAAEMVEQLFKRAKLPPLRSGGTRPSGRVALTVKIELETEEGTWVEEPTEGGARRYAFRPNEE